MVAVAVIGSEKRKRSGNNIAHFVPKRRFQLVRQPRSWIVEMSPYVDGRPISRFSNSLTKLASSVTSWRFGEMLSPNKRL
jgi:hypothetical protein